MDDLLENSSLSLAFGGENANQTMLMLLLPAVVWRAGKTAAAVRFAAVTALVTFVSRGLIQSESLVELLESGEVLPLVFQLLEEDHYADTRISACYVMTRIILTAGKVAMGLLATTSASNMCCAGLELRKLIAFWKFYTWLIYCSAILVMLLKLAR